MCVGFLGQECPMHLTTTLEILIDRTVTQRGSSVEFNSRVSQSFSRSHPIALVVASEITSFVVVVGAFC